MSTWPYPPQTVLTETLAVPVRRNTIGLRHDIVAPRSPTYTRAFRLRYTTIDSAEAAGMWAFLQARRGGFEPFDFVNPNDHSAYRVRCLDASALSLYSPGLYSAGTELTFVVVSG